MATPPTPLHLLTFSKFQSSSPEQQKSIFNQFQAVVVKANRCGCCEVKEMPELPVEIQEMIWGYLDRDGLARCCRLSRYHDGLFRKRLWHKVQLTKRLETISFFECLEGLKLASRARFMECVKERDMHFEEDDPKHMGLVSELFEMEEWDLFRNLEKLTIDGAKPPIADYGEDEPECWSVPLGQLSQLQSLALKNFTLSLQESRIAAIWPDLTSLRLSNIDFGGTPFLDSTAVPDLRHLTLGGCAGNALERFLPLAAQIQTLSISTYELIRFTAGQGQPRTYESILPHFTNLTTLHLSGWNLRIIESISALPKLQHLLAHFHRDFSEEVMEFFTNSQEEWIENTSITLSTWGEVTDEADATLWRALQSRGARSVSGINVEDWLEKHKIKE